MDLRLYVVNFQKILDQCPELVFIGDPILRAKAIEVSLNEGLMIAERLKDTLFKYRNITGLGRGLAGPQIGENKAVFVTYIQDEFQLYLNPRVKTKSDSHNLYRETCLSCGFICVDVKRSEKITLEYMDEKGDMQIKEFDGFLARLLQHENNHLEGVVNIDVAEPKSIEFITKDPLQEKLRPV